MELATALQNTSYKNPKYVILDGLKKKITEMGVLAVPIEVTTTYPARETFEGTQQGTTRPKRLIVIKKLNSKVYKGAIGDTTYGNFYKSSDETGLGWMDSGNFEISVWSPDSQDRDLLLTLMKIWLLELAHKIDGDGSTFLSRQGVLTLKYQREYEEANSSLLRNGVMHIGVLVYEAVSVFQFTNVSEKETIEMEIIASLKENLFLT